MNDVEPINSQNNLSRIRADRVRYVWCNWFMFENIGDEIKKWTR